MYIEDLALNNLQWLIYHKTKPSFKALNFTIILRKANTSYSVAISIFSDPMYSQSFQTGRYFILS